MTIDGQLQRYATDRSISCVSRSAASPEQLLQDAELLVIGTSEDPHCFGHQLTRAAKRVTTPSLGVVDMQVNAERRFRGSTNTPLAFAPDYLAVPDTPSRDAFAALGFPTQRIFVSGHPHYDLVRKRRRVFESGAVPPRHELFPGAPTDRPVWLFLGEGVDQLNPQVSFRTPAYTLHGWRDTDFRGAIVLEELIDAAAERSPRPWMVLRLHPKNRREEFLPCLSAVDAVDAGGDPLPLVWRADLVIGMTTMLLLETCLLGRPHLAVLPRREEAGWLPTLSSGVTPVATTRAELRALVDTATPIADATLVAEVLPEDGTARAVAAIKACLG